MKECRMAPYSLASSLLYKENLCFALNTFEIPSLRSHLKLAWIITSSLMFVAAQGLYLRFTLNIPTGRACFNLGEFNLLEGS